MLPVALAVVVVACFWPALAHEFVNYDDDYMLTGNFNYRGLGAANLRWMFTTFLMGHYQPLSWVTLGIDHALWGMDPRGYHLTNVALHAVNTVLFYWLAITLLGLARARVVSVRGTAALAALLFGIHPLRVESVAWVTERRDLLSGLFLLLTVLAWLRVHTSRGTRQEHRRLWWYGASLACFALSLLSKAWGMTLPVVLLALDAWPLGRFAKGSERHTPVRWLLVEKAPFMLLAGASAIVALFAQKSAGAMVDPARYTFLQRAAQAVYGLCFYIRKTVVPLHLSPLYLADQQLDPSAPAYALSALGVVGAGVLLYASRHRWPAGVVAFACYAILVSPVLGFAQSGPQIVADRYSYLACMPFAVLVAAGFGRFGLLGPVGTTLTVVALAVVAALGTLTWRQTLVWRSSLSLWNHALRLDADHWMALSMRGFLHQQSGDRERALADYDAAIRGNPRHARTFSNRGSLRMSRGDREGAITDWSRALTLDPRMFEARVNRGSALLASGRVGEALTDLEAAVRLDPRSAVAWYQLARAYEQAGNIDAALAACRRAGAAAPVGSRLGVRTREMEDRLLATSP